MLTKRHTIPPVDFIQLLIQSSPSDVCQQRPTTQFVIFPNDFDFLAQFTISYFHKMNKLACYSGVAVSDAIGRTHFLQSVLRRSTNEGKTGETDITLCRLFRDTMKIYIFLSLCPGTGPWLRPTNYLVAHKSI